MNFESLESLRSDAPAPDQRPDKSSPLKKKPPEREKLPEEPLRKVA